METAPSMPVTVRLATTADRAQYISVFELCGLEVRYMHEKPASVGKYLVYVAEDHSGAIVGALEGNLDADYEEIAPAGVEMPQAWLNNLGVPPNSRRQGIGVMLMHRFAEEAARRGLIYAAGLPDQHTDDRERLRFFERCGLRVITPAYDPGKAVGGYLQDILRLTAQG